MADFKDAPRDYAIELGQLETLVRDAPIGIAYLDAEYRYRLINRKLAELNDVSVEDTIGRSVAEVLPHIWPRLKPVYDEVLTTGRPITDVAITGRVGSRSEERHWLAGYYPMRDAAGTVIGIGVVISETTERVRAEQEVHRLIEQERTARESILISESNLRAILAAMPDLIFNLSADGTHLDFYAPLAESLFVEPAAFVGRRVRDVLPPEVGALYESAIRRVLETGAMQVFEYGLDYDDGERRVFDARMVRKSADEVVVMVRDVTELKALEQQLRHAQKMEAIGQLAGGVAHDFNNLLTVINGYAEMLETEVAESAHELLSELRKAGEKAATLTRQLLLFSRRQRVEPRAMSLNRVVEQAETMLTRLLGANVFLTTDLDPDLPTIRADPGQIEQVLVNLAVNARDAMPRGGQLTLGTRTESMPVGAGEPMSWVRLTVHDTGTGMEDKVRERIFEPFFTTKPPGQGTGLGLAVVFGVVQDCGGTIEVESVPGDGTTFSLRFPAAFEAAAIERQPDGQPLPGGDETILLVEDDSAVRGLAVRALEPCGYTIVQKPDGLAALEWLASADGPRVDLVVSDVKMPHLTGVELMLRIRAERPDLPVLLMSGFAEDAALLDAGLVDDQSFMPKPFSPAALATRVRALLDRRGT